MAKSLLQPMALQLCRQGLRNEFYSILKADGGGANVRCRAGMTYREVPAAGGSGQIDCDCCAGCPDEVDCGDAGHAD